MEISSPIMATTIMISVKVKPAVFWLFVIIFLFLVMVLWLFF